MPSLRAAVIALVALAACAPDAAPADAGIDALPDAGDPIAEPAEPATPALGPCPAGWREVVVSGVSACDPWPDGGQRDDCADDEAHLPGEPGCARIGAPCPADGWPAVLPAGSIVYVDDGAAAGGDGATRETALRTITDALRRAPAGTVIAIAEGLYDEAFAVRAGVSLRGACAGLTRLTSTAASDGQAVVSLVGAGSALADLSIETPERIGIAITGAGASIEGVVVRGARGVGIVVAGAGSATARDVAVRDGRARAAGGAGQGIQVQGGGALVLERAVIEDDREVGVLVTGPGSRLDARAVAIARIAPTIDLGRAIAVELGAGAALERAAIESFDDSGLHAESEGSVLVARDLVVRDGEPVSAIGGRGASAWEGARIELDRALVLRATEVGLVATGRGSILIARDAVVVDVRSRPDGSRGRGVEAQAGGRVELERAAIDGAREHAIFAWGAGTTASARDVAVTDVAPSAGGALGRGVEANDGAEIVLARVRIERARGAGLAAGLIARIDAEDVVVRDTASDGPYAMGAWAQAEGSLSLARARIEGSRLVGIGAVDAARVTLSDVRVLGVATSVCAETTCPELAGGFGLSAHRGASLSAERFEVAGAAVCGVVVGASEPGGARTSVDLARGAIVSVAIGACVQAEGYEVGRLNDDVEYREVGVPLQSTSYALPNALEDPSTGP